MAETIFFPSSYSFIIKIKENVQSGDFYWNWFTCCKLLSIHIIILLKKKFFCHDEECSRKPVSRNEKSEYEAV